MKTVPVFLTIPLRRHFKSEVKIPLDITPKEADLLASVIQAQVTDPSESAKFAAADPSIMPGITE
jgi:hypothetical protein